MINSSIKFDLYHFKVMELSTFEDTGRKSECKVLFHFMHQLIKRRPYDINHSTQQWDLDHDPHQRLYLSQDTKRMMEVINNTFAIVYSRRNIDGEGRAIEEFGIEEANVKDHGQQIKWKIDFRIMRFPSILSQHTSAPFLFSPNFTF